MTPPTIAPGSAGAGPVVRAYRRSPMSWFRRVYLRHRGLRDDDLFLASYPRSGSLWLRFLVYEMIHGDASFLAIQKGATYVGWQAVAVPILPAGGRVIKTHEPYRSVYRRAIHLVRDPRDVCVSYFKFMQRMERITVRPGDDVEASFDVFIDALIRGRIDAYGTWQSHLFSWLNASESKRADVLALRYEDLRADPVAAVERMGQWLGLELAEGRAEEVVRLCSLERMRAAEIEANEKTPEAMPVEGLRTGVPVISDGAVEGWRARLTEEQVGRFSAFADGLERMGYPLA